MSVTRPFIMVAPNGARRSKKDHSFLPVAIPDIVATAAACHQAGADALHLHVRDDNGVHSIDAGLYREALIELERQVPTLEVQITTEAADVFDVKAQFECLQALRPKWASISVREMARDVNLAAKVYGLCFEQNIRVQHILYDTDDIEQLLRWKSQQLVHANQDEVLFVLGRYSLGQVSSPQDLAPLRAALPTNDNWMVCAFGPDEHRCLADAARQGGAVRVGFENSLLMSDGRQHCDNAASVRALIQTIEQLS